uniref:Fatty acid hydroxylase domain-containing protein n=1 Tax=Plectus sambesii TaxID=2011161 RepID=A0A914WPM9_9BILA
MGFYAPENFTSQAEIELAKSDRLLQPIWDWVINGREDILRSPLFPPFYALSIDYSFVLIFTIIDLFFADVPFFKKYKIQSDRKVTWDLAKKSLWLQLWNQLLWIYPMALVQLLWVPPTPLPPVAPTMWEFCSQLLIFFLMFDFGYFVFHVVHHRVKFLYRWCHSVHHMYSSPFTAAAQHLHPFELFVVSLMVTCIPWLFPTHCLTYWAWFFIAQAVSYEVHTGYDFPFALHHFIPIYSGAPAHDMHHMRPLTCFEPWLNYLDRIFGYHITYEDLKKMKDKRYGLYSKETETGLQKIN